MSIETERDELRQQVHQVRKIANAWIAAAIRCEKEAGWAITLGEKITLGGHAKQYRDAADAILAALGDGR